MNLLVRNWCFTIISLFLPCSGQFTAEPKDSTGFISDTLMNKYPALWQQTRHTFNIVADTIQDKKILDTNMLIAQEIKRKMNGNPKKASETNEKIYFEKLYMENKADIDIARGKFVISPYYPSFAYFDKIGDPSPELEPRSKRYALKWQISLQMPLISEKYSNTGFFIAFTNRGTFDIFNKIDSRPVTHKTFLPETFLRLDCAKIFKKLETDRMTFQMGAQHESNGGVDDSLSLFDSRGILVKLYLQACVKSFKCRSDSYQRYLRNDKYAFMFSARGIKCIGVEDNPDIVKYIGYLEFNGSFECVPKIKLCNFNRYPGVFMFEGHFSPGGSIEPVHVSYGLDVSYTPPMFSSNCKYYSRLPKLPLTPYFRFFRGYNEFLITYDKPTTVVGFGLKLRS